MFRKTKQSCSNSSAQGVGAGVAFEVSVGVVAKSHLWRCDQTQQCWCFLVRCWVQCLAKNIAICILLGVRDGCGVEFLHCAVASTSSSPQRVQSIIYANGESKHQHLGGLMSARYLGTRSEEGGEIQTSTHRLKSSALFVSAGSLIFFTAVKTESVVICTPSTKTTHNIMYVLFCHYGPVRFINPSILGIMYENVADTAPFGFISCAWIMSACPLIACNLRLSPFFPVESGLRIPFWIGLKFISYSSFPYSNASLGNSRLLTSNLAQLRSIQ